MELDKIRPTYGRVLVRRHPKAGESGGGIILPETQYYKNTKCTVLAVGIEKLLPDGTKVQSEIKVGDTVNILAFDGEQITEDPNILIVGMSEVWATYE